MTPVILPISELEIARSFIAWERSFLIRPCEVIWGGFVCGHTSGYGAHAECTGCEEAADTFLCADHLRAYSNGLLVYHAYPCGWLGFKLKLTDIKPIG